jgi:VCBS repeat-containing protein
VTATPVANLNGTATITLTVSDGALSAQDTIALTVTPVNDVPTVSDVANQTINEDGNTGNLAVTIGDPDSTLSCAGSLTASSSNTTLIPNGNLVIGGSYPNCTVLATAAANLSGSSTITLTASDGVLSAQDTYTVTINAVNDAPTISDVADQTINEDSNTGALTVTIGDVDHSLTCGSSLSGSSSNTTIVPHANIVFAGSAPTCSVTITPAANQNGSATITLTVSDGSATAQDTLSLIVSSINDAPTISNVADQNIYQNANTGALTVTIADVDHSLTCGSSLSGSSSNTTLLPSANIVFAGSLPNCTVTLTPAASQTGSATATLTVSDGTATAQDTILLTVFIPPDLLDNDATATGFGGGTISTVTDVASGYLALKAYSSATDRQYLMSQDFVSSQNLVSYWAFSGNHMDAMFALGTVADTSGYGNDLVITDPSRWLNYMNSAIGVGVNFGDDGCLLSLTNANAGVDLNPGGGDFSFAMWVKKTSGATANTYRPFLYLYSAGNMGIGIALEVLGSDRFNMWVSDGTDNLEVISVPSILTPANGVWYHVAGTRKGSTFTFYMNGIPHGSQTNASIGSIDMTDAVLALAGPGGNDSSHFRGTLDEIIYLKRTLSQEEINSLYSRGVNTYADAAMFTSRIVDLGIPGSLQDFAVTAQAPYGLELPASSAPESEFAAYNADNALLTDLVSLWHFNGTSGSNAGTLDDAEATNDGTPNRGASGLTFQSGRFKTALRLDGVDDNVSLGNDASLQITGDHTISAWMRYESSTIGNFPCLFAKDNEGISAGFGLYVTTGFTIGHFIGNGSYNDTKTSTTIQPWEWVHVAVTHTSGAQKIYINGVQAALSQGGAFAVNPIDTGTEAKLGHCGGAYFPGSLDDVALWNRTLSSTEISALYSRGAVGLKAQVRICAQANCSDGNFVGPSGTSATYFEVDASSAGVIPALFDVSTLSGRYVQYRYWFNSIDSTNTTVMPRINEVEIVLP